MNGVDLKDIAAQPKTRQAVMVRQTWCEIWRDPTGNEDWPNGWVYGRYIQPQ